MSLFNTFLLITRNARRESFTMIVVLNRYNISYIINKFYIKYIYTYKKPLFTITKCSSLLFQEAFIQILARLRSATVVLRQ